MLWFVHMIFVSKIDNEFVIVTYATTNFDMIFHQKKKKVPTLFELEILVRARSSN